MKRLGWVGAALVLLGVVLGFVKSGECGSVFQPRDDSNDLVNAAFGDIPPDCTTALDLTLPVWILIGVGVLLLLVALVNRDWSQNTADTQDDTPSG